ncbi:MAG TPA: hypothetical protein VK787_01860 [Puia sp.]|jgi:hypothetical protein|nr:hypothetical protein [Puia sp.]
MDKKDLSEIKEGINRLIELHDLLKEQCEKEDDYEDEDDEECEFLASLQKDFDKIMNWAFNSTEVGSNKKLARTTWKKLHPTLPMPRIMKSDTNISPLMAAICLFIDIIPLYNAEKKCCK